MQHRDEDSSSLVLSQRHLRSNALLESARSQIIEPEIELLRNGSLGEDIATNTRRMVRYLECLIGKYPDQWNWLTVRLNKHHPMETLSIKC